MNMNKLDYRCEAEVNAMKQKPAPPKRETRRVQLLKREDWETLAEKLGTGEFVSVSVMTRHARKNEAIAQLRAGARIEVKWNENEGEAWYTGTIIGENPKERGTFLISYDCDLLAGGKVDIFLPYTKDHQFRVLSRPPQVS